MRDMVCHTQPDLDDRKKARHLCSHTHYVVMLRKSPENAISGSLQFHVIYPVLVPQSISRTISVNVPAVGEELHIPFKVLSKSHWLLFNSFDVKC